MSSSRSPGRTPRRSKSTVSTGLLLVVGDRIVVRRGRLLGHGLPAEQLLDPAPAGGTEPGPPLGVVEQTLQRRGELGDVPRRDDVGGQAVGSDDLGDGTG